MNYPLSSSESTAEQVAKALWDYIDSHGPPPPIVRSVKVEINGREVEIELFDLQETT